MYKIKKIIILTRNAVTRRDLKAKKSKNKFFSSDTIKSEYEPKFTEHSWVDKNRKIVVRFLQLNMNTAYDWWDVQVFVTETKRYESDLSPSIRGNRKTEEQTFTAWTDCFLSIVASRLKCTTKYLSSMTLDWKTVFRDS